MRLPQDEYDDAVFATSGYGEPDGEEPEICTCCNGSGEGQHDGTTCWQCKGKGAVKWLK
jgi:DnaJ-class molecular chaperone